MSQLSFSDADYSGKRKQTRREKFLAEMERAIPWKVFAELVEPHYPFAYLFRDSQALGGRTLLRLAGEEPPTMEELRAQTQHQLTVHPSRLLGATAEKILNRL